MTQPLIQFLQKLLRNTLSLNLTYLSHPVDDISNIDAGLRKGLANSEELYANLADILTQVIPNHFCFYSDRYDIDYVFFYPYEKSKDIIAIGPFLRNPLENDYLSSLISTHHLTHNEVESIRSLFHQFPLFEDNFQLTSVLADIVNYISPEQVFRSTILENKREIELNVNYTPLDTSAVNMTTMEQLYQLEEPLLDAVGRGDSTQALSITRQFITRLYAPRINDFLSEKKAALYSTNTILRMGARRSNVHPVYLHEISSSFVKQISQSSSITQLNHLHEKMVRHYCMLVQNKSRNQYSRIVRDTLNYIDFNLSQPLTLAILAEYCHISPPHLSKTFKHEVGSTVTSYILSYRIHSSLRLLSTTKLSIQEVATYVGINDLNYYSKVFMKVIGVRPSVYRKNLEEKNRRDV